jgi:hypothetical protein
MRTLGIQLTLDGNKNKEFKYQMHKATIMHDHLKGAEQVGIGFRAIWRMKLQYPIGARCFTHKQCTKLLARYLPMFLSRKGINKTMAYTV